MVVMEEAALAGIVAAVLQISGGCRLRSAGLGERQLGWTARGGIRWMGRGGGKRTRQQQRTDRLSNVNLKDDGNKTECSRAIPLYTSPPGHKVQDDTI
jgi:hypothetical protein